MLTAYQGDSRQQPPEAGRRQPLGGVRVITLWWAPREPDKPSTSALGDFPPPCLNREANGSDCQQRGSQAQQRSEGDNQLWGRLSAPLLAWLLGNSCLWRALQAGRGRAQADNPAAPGSGHPVGNLWDPGGSLEPGRPSLHGRSWHSPRASAS